VTLYLSIEGSSSQMYSRTNLGNQVGKVGIAQQQPATRRDAVGLVLKLVGPQLIEVMETANMLPLIVENILMHITLNTLALTCGSYIGKCGRLSQAS